ncbi:MAG: hypothetical protein GY820_21045 [Gammaproteobacteria bacterium]|nr:hypothetical protein [Gammaproteobacteria bacterium]
MEKDGETILNVSNTFFDNLYQKTAFYEICEETLVSVNKNYSSSQVEEKIKKGANQLLNLKNNNTTLITNPIQSPKLSLVVLRENHPIHGRTQGLELGIVKSEVRQSHSIFLRMFFENIQPVTRHYGAPWGAY